MKRITNKSNFIRSMGNVPAKEVVKAAAAKGIKLSEKYVYNIRAKAKASGGKPGKPGRPKGSVRKASNGHSPSLDAERAKLTEAVLALGLVETERHIEAIKTKAKFALLAG